MPVIFLQIVNMWTIAFWRYAIHVAKSFTVPIAILQRRLTSRREKSKSKTPEQTFDWFLVTLPLVNRSFRDIKCRPLYCHEPYLWFIHDLCLLCLCWNFDLFWRWIINIGHFVLFIVLSSNIQQNYVHGTHPPGSYRQEQYRLCMEGKNTLLNS